MCSLDFIFAVLFIFFNGKQICSRNCYFFLFLIVLSIISLDFDICILIYLLVFTLVLKTFEYYFLSLLLSLQPYSFNSHIYILIVSLPGIIGLFVIMNYFLILFLPVTTYGLNISYKQFIYVNKSHAS